MVKRRLVSCSGWREETSSGDGDPETGLDVVQSGVMCVRLNEGMTGKVILDEYGDREPDYWITDMAPNGTFIKIAEILNLDLNERVSWSNRNWR